MPGGFATDLLEHARTVERQLNRAIEISETLTQNGWAKAYVNYAAWNLASQNLRKLKGEIE
jgi:hypothetical protein